MRYLIATIFVLCTLFVLAGGPGDDDRLILRRGDSNGDGTVNLSDATYIGDWLFLGGPAPPCKNQADVDSNGVINISDYVYLLEWLFQGGPPPAWPGPYNTVCTYDPDPYVGCAVNPCY